MLSLTAVLALVGGMGAGAAHAAPVPSFTRQTGLTCAQCHILHGAPVPNFTFTGKKFRMNGYRTPFIVDKIEAGEQGAISGKRLALNAMPYLSFRYQSVLAEQSLPAGSTQWGTVSSNPTSRFAIFTGGAMGDYFGLWTEMYLVPPNGQATGEWGLGMFTFDEYDLRFVKTINGNTVGLAFSNQGIAEVSGFGPWSPGGSQMNRGGVGGWSHPNKGQFFAYGWFADRLFVSAGASPGQDNLSWKGKSFLGNVAFWPLNSDANEMSINLQWKVGDDDIPLVTNTSISQTSSGPRWSYRDAVQGLSALRSGNAAAANAAYMSSDLGDFAKLYAEARYGFVDRGSHSMELGVGSGINTETYSDNAKAKLNTLFGRVRYVYERTYGLDFQIGKNLTYQFTDRTGVVYDIEDKLTYNTYLTWQPTMNFLMAFRYGNNSTSRLGLAPLEGRSWTINVDYLF
jgi:hypothetical protein